MMFRRVLILFALVILTTCEKMIETRDRMVGIDTVHNVKIDKDTIISRNLKLESRKRGSKSSPPKMADESREPDWSYNPIPEELSEHVTLFKQNMTECLKEVQANDKRPIKRLSPKMESPVNGECLIACVLKRNGVINNGKISKDNLIALVSKFYSKDNKLMKKLDKNLDRCIEISAHIQDECQLASQLNDCTNGLMISNKHKISINY